ncbi:MAG: CooT family nickel-binding protein [Desulfobulbaceae bacterium]|nr:CooT family nickel-binding protein [Desulfobulbaceae bacterium]
MCQTSVVLDRDGEQEKLMENITSLEMLADGVRIAALFEEPREITSVRLARIDFMAGKVILVAEKG